MTINFGIIGGGWRAEFFAKLAKLFPEKWNMPASLIRDQEKGKIWETTWNTTSFQDFDQFIKQDMDFVITSVPRDVNPDFVKKLVDLGIPILSETPPAAGIHDLFDLFNYVSDHNGKVQVAEQYHLRPHNQVQLKLVHEGLIGDPTYAMISSGHGYHGISLIRRTLGIKFETATVWSKKIVTPIVKGGDRSGLPNKKEIINSYQNLYYFEFENNKHGVMDFSYDQYFGFIRNERILIRGEHGEIDNSDVRWFSEEMQPMQAQINRVQTGVSSDINGNYLLNLNFLGKQYYLNPYRKQPLMDEELAVAHTIDAMSNYIQTGTNFYALAEASQDHYLYLLGQLSQRTERTVKTDETPWNIF